MTAWRDVLSSPATVQEALAKVIAKAILEPRFYSEDENMLGLQDLSGENLLRPSSHNVE